MTENWDWADSKLFESDIDDALIEDIGDNEYRDGLHLYHLDDGVTSIVVLEDGTVEVRGPAAIADAPIVDPPGFEALLDEADQYAERHRKEYEALADITGLTIEELERDWTRNDPR